MNRKQIEFESLKDKVHSSKLLQAFEHYRENLTVLSIDCFDTLIWRKTVTPSDIFLELQHQEHFKALNFSAILRLNSEVKARQIMLYKQNHFEVTLNDIYREFDPNLSDLQIQLLAEEEINTELKNCFAFQPVVDLIRLAHQKGVKIILVSDTYFSEDQLRQLLQYCLPTDILPMIHRVFCSSQHKRSKVNGLFENVVRSLGVDPQTILHIGDNLTADYVSARCLGLKALHFIHHDEFVTDLFRLQAISANIVDHNIRNQSALKNPFRALLSMTPFQFDHPVKLIGYASLGPIMYAFAKFIDAEVQQLRQQGKSPKVVFLMRDAFLPSMACEALSGVAYGARVRISRFAALAASFYTEDDVDRYLISLGRSNRYNDIARQLLLSDKVVEPLIKMALRSQEPEAEFVRLLHRKEIMRIIFNKSFEYRQRLKTYLKKEVGMQAGDTFVFVDLGYGGTAQRQLTPMLEEEGIDVVGRYLIAIRTPNWQKNRKGLLDPSWCDDRIFNMLVPHIALLEQLCTTPEPSVVDYDDAGNVIFSDAAISKQQQENLLQIQKECINFICDAKNYFASDSMQELRQFVLIELARMIFLPTQSELKYLESFKLDVNMGTQDVYSLFDPAKGLAGLKRRGLFYAEGNNNQRRTNYPAELRSAGFELALTSMVQNRFGLDIKPRDMLQRQQQLNTVLVNGNEIGKIELEAQATHDGYYSICAPAGAGVSFWVGKKYQWLQIESAELILLEAFVRQSETFNIMNAWPYMTFEDMVQRGNGLYECLSESAVIAMKPDAKLLQQQYVFRLVFRPVVMQTPQVEKTSHSVTITVSS